MDLCKRTQQLWRIYMTAREPGALEEILEWVDPDCVVIGTGRHEFYDRLQPFVDAMGKEMAERRTVHLEIVDEWCAQRELAPDLCLVYGGLHLRDPGLGEEFFVEFRADHRNDVALFCGGDVGLAEGLGREVLALPEGEFQELER